MATTYGRQNRHETIQ
ncbi:hypothetical protein Bhyg_01247 [Pseudolycoriella hygida]|uniref:Uncharacterized protein n=1 Tax=Pseudolycoriella hygida TaxID=35572 RepID=A0A9Q0N972_9DIPT|nr:hypothetical protein Bhyg_01247 [Pseudolycoriella hygida]